MKQLLFLLLFPCLALAQYQGNANQKITLGEQTTADGLVWRGRLADTANLLTNKLDTSVYIVLDTATRAMWYYRVSTTPKWTRLVDSLNNLQGQLSLTTKVSGVLPVANGGTNTGTLNQNKVMVGNGTNGVLTPTNLHWDNTNSRLGVGTDSPTSSLDVRGVINQQGAGNIDNNFKSTTNTGRFIQSLSNDQGAAFQQGVFGSNNTQTLFGRNSTNIAFMYTAAFTTGNDPSVFVIGTTSNQDLILGTNNAQRILIASGGAVTINNLAGINDVGADANGKLQAATSDVNLKNTIENSPFGLNEILLLNPVTFLYNDENRKIDSDVKEVGFIAQDVFDVIPNAVSSIANGDLQLDYRAITATLVKSIQEQQALIKALEQRILILENK